jgi:hypothetical protein
MLLKNNFVYCAKSVMLYILKAKMTLTDRHIVMIVKTSFSRSIMNVVVQYNKCGKN